MSDEKVIVGIDSGTARLALAIPETGYLSHIVLKETGTPAAEIQQLCQWLELVLLNVGLPKQDCDVWLEPSVLGIRGGQQVTLRHSQTIGGVLATVGGTLVAPASWKAAIIGHGHADKTDIANWLAEAEPKVSAALQGHNKRTREDLADAWCIGLYGHLARRHPDQVDPARRVRRPRSRQDQPGVLRVQ